MRYLQQAWIILTQIIYQIYFFFRWKNYGFNNKSYCNKVRKTVEPYEQRQFYLDLFDFAILDTLMYHFDSKHYAVDDNSSARGATIRLDHGRA